LDGLVLPVELDEGEGAAVGVPAVGGVEGQALLELGEGALVVLLPEEVVPLVEAPARVVLGGADDDGVGGRGGLLGVLRGGAETDGGHERGEGGGTKHKPPGCSV